MFRPLLLLALTSTLLPAAPAFAAGGKKATHLGVPPRQVVMMQTLNLPSDNSSHPFLYDRLSFDVDQVTVPEGWSLVVTDLFVHPGAVNDPNFFTLAVFTAANGRTLTFQFRGSEPKHVSLGSGLVVPSGMTPVGRNAGSTSSIEIQLMGYFVRAEGLQLGKSPFGPAPLPE
jgi:hypothetical protein